MSVEPPQRTRKRKKLNVSAIKLSIVFFVGMAVAIGSALTGLAPQTALAPSLTWMFGFAPKKALGSSLRFAVYAVFAAVVGFLIGHGSGDGVALRSLAAFLGATLGAMIIHPLAFRFDSRGVKVFFLTVGIVLTLWVVMDAARLNLYHTHMVLPASAAICLLIGLGVGALTRLSGLPGGVLMVAALYYLGRFSALEAAAASLMVIVLAAILPAWGYAKSGLVDQDYIGAAITGGILGGFGGGLVLANSNPKAVMLIFGISAMFLCARELYRLTILSPDEPTAPSPEN